MSKPLSHPGQYPLSPPESTTHLRHPPDQGMTNNLSSSSQSLATSNHNSANGMLPQQQQQQSNNNISNQQQQQQQNSVGDDLNFDPTAIIDGDGSAAGLEVSNEVDFLLSKNLYDFVLRYLEIWQILFEQWRQPVQVCTIGQVLPVLKSVDHNGGWLEGNGH